METNYYIGILSALILAGSPVKAQHADNGYYNNDGTRIVINNYYDDYDYYYSSRINRFHRNYVAFDYYAPVFTETYWYSYGPDTWGVSIYRGGLGFSFGYNFYYPLYSGFDYYYDYGWYNPYFYDRYYWGYQPYYSNNWYNPVIINIGISNRWDNHYWGRNRHNFWNGYYRGNDYRPVYNTYNNYYYDGSPSARYPARYNSGGQSDYRYQSGRSESTSTGNQSTMSRRNAPTTTATQIRRNRLQTKTNNWTPGSYARRNDNSTLKRGPTGRTNNINPENSGTAADNTRRTSDVRNNVDKSNVVNRSTGKSDVSGSGKTRRSIVNTPADNSRIMNQGAARSEIQPVRRQSQSVATSSGNPTSGRRESTISQSRTTTRTESNNRVSGSSGSNDRGRRK